MSRFSNSGNLGTVLDGGTSLSPKLVPPMEAGQSFLGKNVTHKGDESVAITASRVQRNIYLYAGLTDARVARAAQAGADNPVRYAWQGHYTTDNLGYLKATQGPNAQFNAVVNPWPSENIECNPITVSWESFEKHVIVPISRRCSSMQMPSRPCRWSISWMSWAGFGSTEGV